MSTYEKAKRAKVRRLSSVWLVPVVALSIGLWMAYDTLSSRGLLITLEMQNAEGIEAGKTQVKVNDVSVGRVEDVRLTEDYSAARVSIRMLEGTDGMLNDQTRFWVVKPRVGREGISGLGTLLSGAFIEMQPGESSTAQSHFTALAQPPVLRGNENGVRIFLRGEQGNQLNAGDPVTFRGYTVGRIETVEFNIEEQLNEFSVFVEEPFSQLVTEDVRFWLNSGISLQLAADGVRFDMGSLESLLAGGITFDAVNDARYGESVNDGHRFILFRDRESARQEGFSEFVDYLMLVEDTVRGLSVGAPIEFRGIRVGTVLQVPYMGDNDLGRSLVNRQVPILIRMEPERLGQRFTDTDEENWRSQIESLFERGLRAALRSGNILTGALFVDLVFTDEEGDQTPVHPSKYPIFPMVAGGSGQLDQRVGDLIDNLNQINFTQLGENAERTLAASEEMLTTVARLSEQMTTIFADPAMQELPASLQRTLGELETLLSGYSTDAPAYNDASEAIQRLNRILQDLEPLAETLREQPNSLLFNRQPPADPEPRRPRQ